MKIKTPQRGISLIELLAVLAIIGALAAVVLSRSTSGITDGKRKACFLRQADIELQTKLWKRNNGTYPAANLSNIGGNTSYFPSGLPTCPVDGSSYTIDTATGIVIGHTH